MCPCLQLCFALLTSDICCSVVLDWPVCCQPDVEKGIAIAKYLALRLLAQDTGFKELAACKGLVVREAA